MDDWIQLEFAKWFGSLSRSVAPANDTGVFNYIFEPVYTTNSTLLKLQNFTTANYTTNLLKYMLTEKIQNVQVYNVIRSAQDPAPESLPPRQILGVIIVFSIVLFTALLCFVYACCIACCWWWGKCCHPPKDARKQATRDSRFGGKEPTWSMGSVRAALHDPVPILRIDDDSDDGDQNTLSAVSSDIYLNQPPTLHVRQKGSLEPPLHPSNSLHVMQDDFGEKIATRSTTKKFPVEDKKNHTGKCTHHTLWTVNIIVIFLLTITLCLAFYTADGIRQYTLGISSNVVTRQWTLQSSLSNILTKITGFLQLMVEQGDFETRKTLDIIVTKSHTELNLTVYGLVDSLVTSYKFDVVFTYAADLQHRFEKVLEAANKIRSEQAVVLKQLSTYKGELSAYVSLLSSVFEQLCNQLVGRPQHGECIQLKATGQSLVFNFDASKVQLNPAIGLSVIMEQLNLNLSKGFEPLEIGRREIARTAEKIIANINENFDMGQILDPVAQVWPQVNQSIVVPFMKSLNQARPTVEDYTNHVAYGILAAAYVTLSIYLLLVTVEIVCLALCAQDAYGRSMFSETGCLLLDGTEQDRVTNIIKLTPIYTKHLSLTNFAQDRLHVHGFSIFLAAIFICYILSFIISLVLLIILILVNTEVCPNLDNSVGLRHTDRIVELFLQYEWPNLFNEQTVPKQILEMLDIEPPKLAATALAVSCNPDVNKNGQGLLALMGYSSIFDFKTVLEGPAVTDLLKEAEDILVKEIKNVNFASFIPSNLDELTIGAQNITKYLDQIPYSTTITELSGPFLPVPDLNTYCQQVRHFVRRVTDSMEARQVNSVISLIEQSTSSYESATIGAKLLVTQLLVLQNNQNLTDSLKYLLDRIRIAREIVTDPIQLEQPIRPTFEVSANMYLKTMDSTLHNESVALIRIIAPCADLYDVFQSTMNIACLDQSMINVIGANCIVTALATLLVCISVCVFVRYSSEYDTNCYRIGHKHASLSTCVKITYNEWRRLQPRCIR